MRLAVFDLDDTIAPIGKDVALNNLEKLFKLQSLGYKIAICSGKPVFYLCGFMRQLGIPDAILIGKNGAVIQFGIELPPKYFYIQECSILAKKSIQTIASDLAQLLPNMWYHPNLVGLTPFPSCQQEFDIIQNYLDKNNSQFQDIDIYRHSDSFDIVPKGISKKYGLSVTGQMLNISPKDTICIGNGVNDYPMFEYASLSVGVNVPDPSKVDVNFSNISDALDYLISL